MTQPWNKLTERERDALVAEKLMGHMDGIEFVQQPKGTEGYRGIDLSGCWIAFHKPSNISCGMNYATKEECEKAYRFDKLRVKKYSTDISAAMEVVQTLNRNTPFQHYKIESDNIPDENNRWFWSVSIGSPERGYLKEYGDTLPEAICLAALRARGIEI